jgi:hypothetical protein
VLLSSLALASCSSLKFDDQNMVEFKNGNDGKATFNDLRYDMIRHIATFIEPEDIVNWRYVNCLTLSSLTLKKLVEQIFNIFGLESIADNEPELAGVMALAHTSHDPFIFFKALMNDVVKGKKPYKVLFRTLILHLFQTLPGILDKRKHYQYYKNNVESYMIKACLKKGNFDLVLEIVKDNAYLSGKALESAVRLGHKSNVEILFQSRANITSDRVGWALIYSAKNGHLPILKLLLQSRADIPADYVGWALQGASLNGHTSIVELLLQRHINISAHHVSRALRKTVENGHSQIVELLLQRHIDISADHVGRAHRRAAEVGDICYCLIS